MFVTKLPGARASLMHAYAHAMWSLIVLRMLDILNFSRDGQPARYVRGLRQWFHTPPFPLATTMDTLTSLVSIISPPHSLPTIISYPRSRTSLCLVLQTKRINIHTLPEK